VHSLNSMTYMKLIPVFVGALTLAACAVPPQQVAPGATAPVATAAPPSRPAPPPDARTPEAFDTVTEAERVAARAPAPGAGTRLGTTIASLGPPGDTGIWLETGLVTQVTPGRVEYPRNGRILNVELRPSGRAPGSGSQISLSAMRLLDAPLTGLPELVVYQS
jgi:hypothetical protein